LTAKPATAFPEFVYVTIILNYISASNYSLNHPNIVIAAFSLISSW